MKTAISIPDDLFKEAENHARATGQSRSSLYSQAIREYLARHVPDAVTEALNRVCEEEDENRAFIAEASRRIMQSEEW